jgi:hypothetical protein
VRPVGGWVTGAIGRLLRSLGWETK